MNKVAIKFGGMLVAMGIGACCLQGCADRRIMHGICT